MFLDPTPALPLLGRTIALSANGLALVVATSLSVASAALRYGGATHAMPRS